MFQSLSIGIEPLVTVMRQNDVGSTLQLPALHVKPRSQLPVVRQTPPQPSVPPHFVQLGLHWHLPATQESPDFVHVPVAQVPPHESGAPQALAAHWGPSGHGVPVHMPHGPKAVPEELQVSQLRFSRR
jgi:hypothetical protein